MSRLLGQYDHKDERKHGEYQGLNKNDQKLQKKKKKQKKYNKKNGMTKI